ncbi:MAG: substrate-binding domain-containing protein, partial [Bifidobacteriaceae bacterium]|nr:substrate-binding domain-containing protein [Bifidobacteriaceae bacterium]
AGIELELTPIGREAFVFFVSRRNPVSGLTQAQVRQIYSGQVTDWKDVGGPRRQIDAYQRNPDSGSQTAFEDVMAGVEIMDPPSWQTFTGMDLMAYRVLDYKNSPGAIGFSFRYYLDSMIRSDEIKLLAIDGVAPTLANTASGEYPFARDFYAVTARARDQLPDADGSAGFDRSARAENAARLIDWIASAQGQELVRKVGYSPLAG